ncbi:hypothetical protein GGTG_08468 [Gaeumannomyces tritici R3-111a-1]|uniref:Mmc protein n=1 Tax=Gaeumannomyces tritici (strain R3-111a-1) TaxID=644352 RepID=J3P4N1_GAET3|nr:hypothetical protein GGTG_08468 [Gaeumannomyces tritici R3-111a-1]EJT74628.1 hypothetical protein GGTG_08468 [Gaeumannomyces tritici R3-111a-1]
MPSKHILLAAAAAALAVAPAAVLAQTFNNVNDIANSNSNSNNVDVSVGLGGGPVVAVPPTTLSTRTVTAPTYMANSTSMTVTTTVVTAWSTYCPEPTVLWFEKERYVVTKPTMLTYKNCPCTITTKVPVHTDLPVRPAVVPVYPPAPVQPVHPVVVVDEPVHGAAPVATPIAAPAPVVAPVARVGTVTHNGHYVVPTAKPDGGATMPVTAGANAARDARGVLGLAVAAGVAAVGAFAM